MCARFLSGRTVRQAAALRRTGLSFCFSLPFTLLLCVQLLIRLSFRSPFRKFPSSALEVGHTGGEEEEEVGITQRTEESFVLLQRLNIDLLHCLASYQKMEDF